MVAILDPRLVTAWYGAYLRASLLPMWATADREAAWGTEAAASGMNAPLLPMMAVPGARCPARAGRTR